MAHDHPLLKNRIRYYLITAFFIVVTAALIIFFLFNVRIKDVEFENCVYSSENSVKKAANIKIGTHSYGIDKAKIAKAIKAANPYVTDVRIKRTGISSISVILTEDAPRFYIEHDGEYIILSETLRVLDEYDSLAECAELKVYPISLMPIDKAELGKTLVFEKNENEDGVKDVSVLSAEDAISMLSQISESDLSGTITQADLSDRFDIRLTYKNKYEIRFGAPRAFEDKLMLVMKTIAYLENPENGYSSAKGIIYASVDNETSFEPTGIADDAQKPDQDEKDESKDDKETGKDKINGDKITFPF
jgi:hypothetical protein